MKHPKKINERALRRLKIVQGQLRGLEKMIEENKYCIEIITQSLAIKEALSGIEDLILENHLGMHVAEQMRSGQTKKATAEIVKIYKLSKKK